MYLSELAVSQNLLFSRPISAGKSQNDMNGLLVVGEISLFKNILSSINEIPTSKLMQNKIIY